MPARTHRKRLTMTNDTVTQWTPTTFEEDYAALHQAAAVLHPATAGVVEVTDADRVDFLQRMTTNNIVTIPLPGSVVTVLTSPVARILSVFTVVNLGERLLLLPPLGQTEVLTQQLQRQIFFMDKVKVQNCSDVYHRLRVVGPHAETVLAFLGFADLSTAADGAVTLQDELIVVKQSRLDLPGYEIVVPTERGPALLRQLQQAHAHLLPDDDAYQVRRVEVGRPGWNAELREEFTPLEAGLAWTCAENKGCYTGQEIIARQITYDKVTRFLAGVTGDAAFSSGDTVTVDGRAVGVVTSAVYSPQQACHVGLAVLRRPHHEAGQRVQIGEATATVSQLPLVDQA